MAVDPRVSAEDKKRLKAKTLVRALGGTAGAAFTTIPNLLRQVPLADIARVKTSPTSEYEPNQHAILRPGAIVNIDRPDGTQDQWPRAPQPEAPAPAPAPDPNIVDENSIRREAATEGRRNPGAYGLTRIVKNPDGSYTNMAQYEQPGAEQRYYDAQGSRADLRAPTTGFSAPAGGVTEAFARDSANAIDLGTDDAAMFRAMQQGRRSLETAEQGTLLRQQRTAQREYEAMTPAERIARMQEGGRNARADATNQIAMGTQSLARDAQDFARERHKDDVTLRASAMTLKEVARLQEMSRTDPAGALRIAMTSMANLTPEARQKRMADPDDPMGALVRTTLQRQVAGLDSRLGPNMDPAAIRRGNAVQSFFGGKYQYGGGFNLLGFDPEKLIPGMSQQDMEDLIESGALLNVARDRGR